MILCISESAEFRNLYKKVSNELKPVRLKKENLLSTTDTATLRVQIEILSQVVECCTSASHHLDGESKAKIVAHMDMLLRVVRQQGKKISGREIDINMEIHRFHRVCQLHRLKSEPNYRTCCDKPEVKE
jgi:ribonuclease PH